MHSSLWWSALTIFAALLVSVAAHATPPPVWWDPSPPCPDQVDEHRAALLEAFREMETTRKDVDAIRARVDAHFTAFPIRAGGSEFPVSAVLPILGVNDLDLAVSAFARGQDEHALRALEGLFSALPELLNWRLTPENRQALERQARAAAADPLVYRPLSVAEFLLAGAPTIEAMFLAPAIPALAPLRAPGDPSRSFLGGRAQQLEGVKAVLQYTATRPGDRVLEVGYLSLGALLTLRRYLNGVKFVGIDVNRPSPDSEEPLRKADVELLTGVAPAESEAKRAVESRGPYSVIYAIDTVVESTTGRDPFGVGGAQYVAWLADLLGDGGTLVILNDYERKPYFSRQEAERAGLRVIRWEEPRRLGSLLRNLSLELGHPTSVGKLSLFVLRKGATPPSRIEARD